jgi:Resolvase, N terminal domain
LTAEFTEVESGKHHENRPQLAAAIEHCKQRRCTLLIATLDRLARNVHFISGLMETKVPFVAADRPTASAFEIHIARRWPKYPPRDMKGRFVPYEYDPEDGLPWAQRRRSRRK